MAFSDVSSRDDRADLGGDPPCWAHLFEADDGLVIDDATLAAFVRGAADAIVIADRTGVISFWNTAATRVLGWTADEAVGASLDLIIPERWRDRHWDGYRRVMKTGQTAYGGRLLEVPALHRDGRTISIAFTVSLLSTDDGSVAAIAAVIRDDTARRAELRRWKAAATAARPTADDEQG